MPESLSLESDGAPRHEPRRSFDELFEVEFTAASLASTSLLPPAPPPLVAGFVVEAALAGAGFFFPRALAGEDFAELEAEPVPVETTEEEEVGSVGSADDRRHHLPSFRNGPFWFAGAVASVPF